MHALASQRSYEANDHDVADTTIETDQLDPLDFSVDLSSLEKAQELTDRGNTPVSEISYP